MTSNDLFKSLLKDPSLIEEYALTKELLGRAQLHNTSDSDIIEVIKLIVQGVEDGTPRTTLYTQIKRHFNL